jgi:hypothetical protein
MAGIPHVIKQNPKVKNSTPSAIFPHPSIKCAKCLGKWKICSQGPKYIHSKHFMMSCQPNENQALMFVLWTWEVECILVIFIIH